MVDQIPFGDENFTIDPQFPPEENFEQRCPVVLLLDTSYSMSGSPITALNEGLSTFQAELAADSLAAKRVEVAIVTFGGEVSEVTPFTTARHFSAPHLEVNGATPMGEAVLRGIEMITQRKNELRQQGIPLYRPWIFLMTDGVPTDNWDEACRRVADGETRGSFAFFGFGVEDADMNMLAQLNPSRKPVKLRGLCFREMFVWLSASLKAVSQSQPGDQVKLQPPDSAWTV